MQRPTGIIHRRWINVRKLGQKSSSEVSCGGGVTLWAPQDLRTFDEKRRGFEERLSRGELVWDEILIYPYCENEETRIRIDDEGNVIRIVEGPIETEERIVTVKRGQEPTAYVIHVGRRYRNIAKGEEGDIGPNKPLILEPGDTVIVETLEYIALSHNIAGIISPAVSPLESGLEQETCYVDPGYCGWLSEVISNRTNRQIILKFGTPFCKLTLIRIDVDPYQIKEHANEDRYKGPRFGRGLRPPQPPPGMSLGSVSPVLPYKLHERLTKLEGPWMAIYLTVVGILIAVFASFALNIITTVRISFPSLQILIPLLIVAITVAILLMTIITAFIVLRSLRK